MLNNDPWKSDKLAQDDLTQRHRHTARRTALIAGFIALMFYVCFMLLGILNQ